MYALVINNETELYRTEQDAVDALIEQTNASIERVTITPDVLTVLYNLSVPWSMQDKELRTDVLYAALEKYTDIDTYARKRVLAELQMMRSAENPPADAHPCNGDDASRMVESKVDAVIDREQFSSYVVETVRQRLTEKTDDRTEEYWRAATETLDGTTPHNASVEKLKEAINELE